MRQLTQQARKVLLILVLLISTGYTGILSNSGIDIAEPTSASTGKYVYTWEVGYMPSGYTTDARTGDKINMTIDFSNNSMTFDKQGWGFGDYNGQMNEGFLFTSLFNTATYNYYTWWSYSSTRTIKGSSATLSTNGANYFSGLTVGAQIYGFINGTDSSGDLSPFSTSYILKSKVLSNGGSCPPSTKYVYEFEVTNNQSSYPEGFTMGTKWKVTIDESNNAISTNTLGWGIADYGNQAYSQFAGWFTSTGNPTKQYQPSNALNDIVYYFDKSSGVLNAGGAQKFKQMSVGQVFWGEGVSGYRWYSPTDTLRYGKAFSFKLNSKVQEAVTCNTTPAPTPPPTTTTVYPRTCASGLTPKGTPGTANFYCEKPVKVTEKEYIGANDINLENIMGEFGSNGERADGQFDLDSGNHNNGWYLNGNGDSYKSNHVQFTNIPDNGHVNAIGNSWQPEYLITQGKLKIEVPKSPKATAVESQKRDTDLNTFKTTKSLSEVLAYKVTDLDKLKEIQNANEGLSDLFVKTGSTYKYGSDITSHVVNSQGEGVYNNFKINESGYYIIASKYIDMVSATKEQATPSQDTITKHTYYSFIPVSVNFMTDLGYLPIQNNLLTQINDSILTMGNKKANHKLPNLAYETYKSLKAPSAFNHTSGKTVIGSTSGGIQLLSKDLSPIAVSTTLDVANIKITDVVEHNKGFYVSSDKGILYLNCDTNELAETSIKEAINDLEVGYDNLYYLTDDKLSTIFITDGGLINSNKDYDLSTMFKSPSTKAGRVEVVGNLITISSKDDSSDSEIITLAK